MKTAIFLVGGVLVAYSLFLSEAATLARPAFEADYYGLDYGDFGSEGNNKTTYHCPTAVRFIGCLRSLCARGSVILNVHA